MDLHTLHVAHAALLGLFTLLTIANSYLHRGARGSQWFSAFTCSAFVAAMLIVLRGRIPETLSIVLGGLLFSFAYVLLHRSLAEFFGKSRQLWRAQLLSLGICLMALLRWGVIVPETRTRLLWYSVILSVQVGLIAVLVLRNARGTLLRSGSLMGGLLVLLSANNLARALIVHHHGAPADYLRGGLGLCVPLLLTTVLQGGVTIAFVWMTAARLHGELIREATTDPLTRLLNRRAIEERARLAIAASLRTDLPVCAILIDLDDFKAINDLWGHACGDDLLQMVARCLESGMRPEDRVARLGGDEFAILLPRTSIYEAMDLAEGLRGSIADMRPKPGCAVQVHASFGVAQMTEPEKGWGGLMQVCDERLYRSKAKGGNRVLVS